MPKTRWILLSAALIAVSACASATITESDVDLDHDAMMDDHSSAMSDEAPYLEDESTSSSDDNHVDLTVEGESSSAAAAPSSDASQAQARVMTIAVDNWSFSPNVINVKQGEKITLQLIGGDGIHSFAVPELGLNVRVEPGQTVSVELPTDQAGTFDAMCRIPCGPGHKDMKATIVIS